MTNCQDMPVDEDPPMVTKASNVVRYLLTRLLERGERYYGLNRLDQKLKMYLPWWSGFFVEVGANDGVTQSNTCYFERSRNWTGLLIEPIPEIAAKCRRNRPGSIVEQCALVGAEYKEMAVHMHYCNLMSVMNGTKGSVIKQAEHLHRGAQCQKLQTYEIDVPASTLTALCEKHNINKIDFMSLDVEGYEFEVLQGLDISRYRPLYLLIEGGSRKEIKFLLDQYYEPIAILSCINDDVLYRAKQTIVTRK